jgi:hypothetical protein
MYQEVKNDCKDNEFNGGGGFEHSYIKLFFFYKFDLVLMIAVYVHCG